MNKSGPAKTGPARPAPTLMHQITRVKCNCVTIRLPCESLVVDIAGGFQFANGHILETELNTWNTRIPISEAIQIITSIAFIRGTCTKLSFFILGEQ